MIVCWLQCIFFEVNYDYYVFKDFFKVFNFRFFKKIYLFLFKRLFSINIMI